MKLFVRAVEIWAPNEEGSLEFRDAIYDGELEQFREISELALFPYDEGLPGKAWAAGRPIIMTSLSDADFRRADEAKLFGLNCGVAIPVFAGSVLKAVLGLLCGHEADDDAGAIELWHNDANLSHELSLVDGYYGTAEAFELTSRNMRFPRGYGLPGKAWKRNAPVIIKAGQTQKFLRAEDAAASGIELGLAIPFKQDAESQWVITLLSGLKTPVARRLEVWKPGATPDVLEFESGYCVRDTDLDKIYKGKSLRRGEGIIGECWVTGAPAISTGLAHDSSAIARPALKAGLKRVAAIPVFRDAELSAIIAWYF